MNVWFVFCREEPSNGWHRAEAIRLEQDVFTALAGQGKLYVYKTLSFWSQIKSAGWVHIIVNAVKPHRMGLFFSFFFFSAHGWPRAWEPKTNIKQDLTPSDTGDKLWNYKVLRCAATQNLFSHRTPELWCWSHVNIHPTFIRMWMCDFIFFSALPFMPVGCISTSTTKVTQRDWPQMRREAQKYVVSVLKLKELCSFYQMLNSIFLR